MLHQVGISFYYYYYYLSFVWPAIKWNSNLTQQCVFWAKQTSINYIVALSWHFILLLLLLLLLLFECCLTCNKVKCQLDATMRFLSSRNFNKLHCCIKLAFHFIIIIIVIIIIINCNWVVTRWQWLFYMYTKHEIGY